MRSSAQRSLARASTLVALLAVSPAALANDGVYGRFDGDVALGAGAGIEQDFRESIPRLVAVGTARFYQAIGLRASLSQSLDSSDRLERVLGVGLVVEPLFLLRWSNDVETERPTWDLFVDSWSLQLGAYFAEPRGSTFAAQSGVEAGIGAGVPLASWASGPWLRARGALRAGPSDDATGVLQVWFEWQGFLESGIVGVGE